jgi:hypothetical protein
MQRRGLLKKLAVGTVMSTTVGTVAGKYGGADLETAKKHIKKAGMLEATKGKGAKEDFLEDMGYQHASKNVTARIGHSKESDEEIETLIQDPQDGGIEVQIDGFEPRDPWKTWIGVSLRPRYKFKKKCNTPDLGPGPGRGAAWRDKSQGITPRDAGALKWNTRQRKYFELTDGGGENATFVNDFDASAEWAEGLHNPTIGKTGFKLSDVDAYSSWEEQTNFPDCGVLNPGNWGETVEGWQYGSQVGILLEEAGDWDPDERVVGGSYTYTQANVDISASFGWSAGKVISVTPEWQVENYPITTDPDGDNLEIHQSEIV